MLGYVTPEKSELKLRENEVYSAYYCGLCREIGKAYGQLPRIFLNFDFVFLAMLLAAVETAPDDIYKFRCPIHPMRKKAAAVSSPTTGHAVRMMLILSYFKSVDDKNDEGSYKAHISGFVLRRAHKKISRRFKEKSDKIKAYIEQINTLEKEHCASFDRIAEPFALLMEEVFDCNELELNYHPENYMDGLRYALRRIGHYLGKWIYLIDAFDDLDEDVKTGAYNPLILNYGFGLEENKGESIEDFKGRIAERISVNALLYLSDISEMLELLPIKKNLSIIENIIYIGLRRKTEEVLQNTNTGTSQKPKPSSPV